MSKSFTLSLLVGALMAQPAFAQVRDSVSANDPEGMAKLLDITGYEPELSTDEIGDPMIEAKVAGYATTLFFYGCDEATHTNCSSVQFEVAFDRKEPWPAAEAVDVARKWRYVSIWLNKEGDPVARWDLFTGDGIPSKVFLQTVQNFGNSLDETASLIFPDDGSQNTTGD